MGYMRHHAIVVTSYDADLIGLARTQALEIFPGCMVTGVMVSPVNGYRSFFVSTDGSKEGWAESERGDTNRECFVGWLEAQKFEDGSSPLSWAEVQYGDEAGLQQVVRASR